MTDPNVILESIEKLQKSVDVGFALLLVVIGVCAIAIVFFINQRTGGRND